MKLICVNAGFYNTKIKTNEREEIFESKIQINDDARQYILSDDICYEIGEGNHDISNKFDNDTHRLCTEYAILKHTKHFDSVNLMLALPMGVYLNKTFRKQYENSFNNKTLSYETDTGFKSVIIKKATVYMEGASAMLVHQQKFEGIVGLVDIGGNTINCAIFNNGKILLDTVTTLDLGMIKLYRSLIDEINIQKGLNVQNYEVCSFFKQDDVIVKKVVNTHIKTIKQRLLEKKWNLDSIPLIFTGGGADDLRLYLPKHFKQVFISQEPIMDNIRGLWKVGRVIYK